MTGTVPDVRPYLQHAAAVVGAAAALRVASRTRYWRRWPCPGPSSSRLPRCRASRGAPGSEFEVADVGPGICAKGSALCSDTRTRSRSRPCRPGAHPRRLFMGAEPGGLRSPAGWRASSRDARHAVTRAMHIEPRAPLAAAETGVLQPLGAFVAVAACILVVLGIFWPTTESMVEIWRRSETFQHCFAVIPIVLWLVWDQRDRLAATPIRPYWPGLTAMLAFGLAWMLGLLGAAQVISHFALIALVGASCADRFRRRVGPRVVVSTALSVLCRAVRRGDRTVADGPDRGLHRNRAAADRRARVPRGHALRHPERAVVGDRGLQWDQVPDRLDHGRVAVCVADVPVAAPESALPAGIDCRSAAGQLASRLHDRPRRPPEQQSG